MTTSLPYDVNYLKSISGISKICALLCCFIGFLTIMCSSVDYGNFRGLLYISAAAFGFCCTAGLLLAHGLRPWERKYHRVNILKYESYLHCALALTMFLAAAFTLSLNVVSYSVATFFGLLAFCFYVVDAYLCYRLSRKCDAATQTDSRHFAKVCHM